MKRLVSLRYLTEPPDAPPAPAFAETVETPAAAKRKPPRKTVRGLGREFRLYVCPEIEARRKAI